MFVQELSSCSLVDLQALRTATWVSEDSSMLFQTQDGGTRLIKKFVVSLAPSCVYDALD